MKNKSFKKMLIIGTISLFFVVTIGNASILQKNQSTTEKEELENHLADITIIHGMPIPIPILTKPIFTPAENLDFYFPEIDGKVYLNFTIRLHHMLATPLFFARDSVWSVYVKDPDEPIEYIANKTRVDCTNTQMEDINWTVNYDIALDLEANNTKTLTVLLYTGGYILDIIPLPLKGPYVVPYWELRWPGCKFSIDIHAT